MRKSNCKFQFLFFLLFLFAGCQLMSAQQISIKGTVTDPSGEPLIGVSVTVPAPESVRQQILTAISASKPILKENLNFPISDM